MQVFVNASNYWRILLFVISSVLIFAGGRDSEVRAESSSRSLLRTAAGDAGHDAQPTVVNISRQVYRLFVDADTTVRSGTAFLVNGSRIIATNNHVIERGKFYTVGYVGEQGEIKRVGAKLLAVFPQKDLALLETSDDLPGHALPLARDYPDLASDLYAFGFPAAADIYGQIGVAQNMDRSYFSPSVLKGTISRVIDDDWLTNQLQHQTPISPGYSGGPLVDGRGIVIGISTAINKEASGISYAVPARYLAHLLTACAFSPRVASLRNDAITDAPQTTASIARPSLPPEEQALLQRGYRLLKNGDVAGARVTFEYIARKSGYPDAYEALAKTYDPVVLKELHVIGNLKDSDKAEEYYRSASRSAAPGQKRASDLACSNSRCMLVEGSGVGPLVVCERSDQALVNR